MLNKGIYIYIRTHYLTRYFSIRFFVFHKVAFNFVVVEIECNIKRKFCLKEFFFINLLRFQYNLIKYIYIYVT